MKLFGYYRSSCSYRIRIVLNLKGLDWDYEAVALNRGEQATAAYTSHNPSALVPMLDTGSATIGQSSAIAEYLEESYPQPALLPADPLARARVREIQAIIGADIQPLQNLRVLNCLRDELGVSDDVVGNWIRLWMSRGLAAAETLVACSAGQGPYACGPTATLADAWLIPQLYNALRFKVDVSNWPRLCAVNEHCLAQPAFAAAMPERQPDAPTA